MTPSIFELFLPRTLNGEVHIGESGHGVSLESKIAWEVSCMLPFQRCGMIFFSPHRCAPAWVLSIPGGIWMVVVDSWVVFVDSWWPI